MSLYESWNEILEGESDEFWKSYLAKEKSVYEDLLNSKTDSLKITISEFSKKYELEPVLCVGFIDGINTSLDSEIDLESLNEESEVELKIDFEKLFFNMHKAKADWLYNIPAWNEILSADKQKEIKRAYADTVTVRIEDRIGRNDPCPCGSGKKYKKCCLNN